MRTAGEILREARQKKGLTLAEAEKSTKIRKSILQALEDSRWSDFPPTYTKGLLKNYGGFLGIEEEKILAFFRREFDEKKAPVAAKPTKISGKRFHLTPAVATAFLLSLVVLGVLTYLFVQFRSFTAAPKLEIQQPADNSKISSLETTVVGQTWSDANLKINGEKVEVSPGGSFSVSVGLKEGINTLTISSANQFGKTTTVTRSVVVLSEEDTPAEAGLVSMDLEIDKKPTFVEITTDGNQVFSGLMLSGSKKRFTAKEKIKIRTENGATTKVVVGGEVIILGAEGEMVEREFGQ